MLHHIEAALLRDGFLKIEFSEIEGPRLSGWAINVKNLDTMAEIIEVFLTSLAAVLQNSHSGCRPKCAQTISFIEWSSFSSKNGHSCEDGRLSCYPFKQPHLLIHISNGAGI